MRKKWIFIVPAAILGILLVMAIGGVVVQQLWNWLLPALFGWRQVTFWQALGLLVLCRILFGGLGRHGGPKPYSRRLLRDRARRRMAERWERMTPEERQRFREGLRGRCGFDPPSESGAP